MAEETVPTIEKDRIDEFVEQELQRRKSTREEIKFDDFLRELSSARRLAVGQEDLRKREAELVSGDEEITPSRAISIPGVIRKHADSLNLTDKEFVNKAAQVGLQPDFFIESVGRKGMSPAEALSMARDRGNESFLEDDAQRVKIRGRAIKQAATARAPYVDKPEFKPLAAGGPFNPTAAELVLSEERSNFGTDIEDEELVAQQGEVGSQIGYLVLKQYKEGKKDPDKAMLDTINLYANDPFQQGHLQFIKGFVDKELSFQPELTDDASKEEARESATKAAIYELAALKTAGLWTAPIFLPLDMNDRGQWKLPESGEYTLKSAIAPSIEVVGLSPDSNQVIMRQQGRLGTVFKALDALQGAAVGVLDKDEGESLKQSALRGVAEQRNFLEAALDTEFARKSTTGKVLAGAGGLAAMVLTPDVAFGFASTATAGKKLIQRSVKSVGSAKAAKGTMIDAENVVKALGEGVNNNNWDLFRETEGALAKVGSESEKLVKTSVDLLDAEIAQASERLYPELMGQSARALDDRLPGQISGRLLAAHQSERAARHQVDGLGFLSREERFGYGDHLSEIDAARDLVRVKDPTVLTRRAYKDAEGDVNQIKDLIESQINSTRQANQKIKDRDLDPEWSEAMKLIAPRAEGTRKSLQEQLPEAALNNPAQWARDTQAVLRQTIGADPKIDAVINSIARKASAANNQANFDDMAAALDRAEELVKVGAETRATAWLAVRDAVAEQFDIPKNVVSIPGQRLEEGTRELVTDLSPDASRFVQSLERAGLSDRAEALNVGFVADAMARSWAKRTGKDSTDWWVSRLKGVDLQQATGQQLQSAVEVIFNDGRAVVRAFGSPAIDEAVGALSNIARRDLAPDDVNILARWLGSKGIQVRATKGVLEAVAGQPDAIKDADRAISKAFTSYLAGEAAPTAELAQIFENMKHVMGSTYQATRPQVPKNVRNVFDDMLVEQQPDGGFLSRIGRVITDKFVGPGSQRSALQEIAEEARVRDLPVDVEDLRRLIDQGQDIVFPKAVISEKFAPLNANGRQVIDQGVLSRLQKTLDSKKVLAETEPPFIGALTAGQRFEETSASQYLKSLVAKGEEGRIPGESIKFPGVLKLTVRAFFGGDAYADLGLRKFPQVYRDVILSAGRPIQQSIGDAIRIAAFGKRTDFTDFLGGKQVTYETGRVAATSGDDVVDAALEPMRRAWSGLSQGDGISKAQARLMDFFAAGRAGSLAALGKDTKAAAEEVIETMNRVFSRDKGGTFFGDTLRALKLSGDETQVTKQIQVLEHMLYMAGLIGKPPYFGTGVKRAEDYLDGLAKIMGGGAEGTQRSVHAGVVSAAYGQAERSRYKLSRMGLVIDSEMRQAYRDWLNGFPVKKELLPRVKELSRKIGLNAELLKDDLFDTEYFIPKAAMERMFESLSQSLTRGASFGVKDGVDAYIRYLKVKMIRGTFILKPRYFTMNTIDHFTQTAMNHGFRPALSSMLRMSTQNLVTHPYIQVPLTAIATTGLNPRLAEKLRRGAQKMGDAMSRVVGGRAVSIDTNKILDGNADDFVQIGDKFYSAKDIRSTLVEEGIFSSFDTRELERIIDTQYRAFFRDPSSAGIAQRAWRQISEDMPNFVADMAESWSERERVGAALTFMEMGLSPREAAQMAVRSLYDYAGTATKGERSWFIMLAFPFWTYQKNANAHVFDMLFSPWGAYRMGMLRRGLEGKADLLTYALYEGVVDPYGVDSQTLREEMSPEKYSWYFAMRKVLEFGYGPFDQIDAATKSMLEDSFGPLEEVDEDTRELLENGFGGPHKVPEEVRRAVRMIVQGKQVSFEDGKIFQLETDFYGEISKRGVSLENLTIPKPSKSDRRFYQENLSGIALTTRATEIVRKYYDTVPGNYQYTEIFLPESTIHAGFKHISGVLALETLAASALLKGTVGRLTEGEDDPSISSLKLYGQAFGNVMAEMIPVDRAPLIGDALAQMNIADTLPVRVDEHLVGIIQSIGLPVQKLEAFQDVDGFETLMQTDVAAGRMTEEQARAISTHGENRYYLPPGFSSAAFRAIPFLMDMNNAAMLHKISPASSAAGLQQQNLERAARFLGLNVSDVNRELSAKREEPRFQSTTTTPR